MTIDEQALAMLNVEGMKKVANKYWVNRDIKGLRELGTLQRGEELGGNSGWFDRWVDEDRNRAVEISDFIIKNNLNLQSFAPGSTIEVTSEFKF